MMVFLKCIRYVYIMYYTFLAKHCADLTAMVIGSEVGCRHQRVDQGVAFSKELKLCECLFDTDR